MKGRVTEDGTILPSGIKVLNKTEKFVYRGKDGNVRVPIYKMQCTCGTIFEHTYKKELKSCGNKKMHPQKKKEKKAQTVDHSGEILPSGVKIIEKTEEPKEWGGSLFPVYLQQCSHCENIFKAVYVRKRKSCGCINGKDRTGEVLPSGIKLIKRLDKQNKHGSYYYIQKCGLCGKEFEGVYNQKRKSCGCISNERDRSGETNQYGVKILRKVGEVERNKKYNQNCYIYEMECPICEKVFKSRYNQYLKSCGCLPKSIYDSEERKQLLKNVNKKGHEKNERFGTNLGLIASNRIPKSNTSGYKGVRFYNTTGKWYAEMRFQGCTHRKSCKSKEEAINERKKMEEERNIFINWYDSLSEDEKEFFSKQYDNNKKEFSRFYKEKLKEILQSE